MRPPSLRTTPHTRLGLTLIELLVTVALMLLIMSVIVAIFQSATGAMTIAQKDQELAMVTRRLDTVIRQDLEGVTARLTPPLNPNDGLGYFEYGENALSDAQDEDSDDYLAMTVKAPAGQPFTGRIMLRRNMDFQNPVFEPTTITSDFAEVIYFSRHGNLYRRVLLIAPELADTLELHAPVRRDNNGNPLFLGNGYPDYIIAGGGYQGGGGGELISWQGANDISVRPPTIGRAAPVPNTLGDLTNRHNRAFRPRFQNDYLTIAPDGTVSAGPDGQADDANFNAVPDFYPTIYPNAARNPNAGFNGMRDPTYPNAAQRVASFDTMPFPFVFPNAYSTPDPFANPGAIHIVPLGNHSPLDIDDNLPVPDGSQNRPFWTWWGFPTWAETRSPTWTHATKRLGVPQPGIPFPNGTVDIPSFEQAYGLSRERGAEPFRPVNHWYSDGAGTNYFIPNAAWQDDLIATNVRGFDIKALDPNVELYSDPSAFPDKQVGPLLGGAVANLPDRYFDLGYAASFPSDTSVTQDARANNGFRDEEITFGHEGRIPPLTTDGRINPATGLPIGDNNNNVVRLRRVWDTWSTDYSAVTLRAITGGPSEFIYPSFPPPYPSPLRGIQIQIRIASPDNQRLKVLTIRHDFSDRL